jgi:hypothetical protein
LDSNKDQLKQTLGYFKQFEKRKWGEAVNDDKSLEQNEKELLRQFCLYLVDI